MVLTVGDQDERDSNNAPHGEFLRSDGHRFRTEVAGEKKILNNNKNERVYTDAIVVQTTCATY